MDASQITSIPTSPRLSLTLTEGAALLGISLATLTRAADRGEIKLVKIGARRRVPTAEIERVLSTSAETK